MKYVHAAIIVHQDRDKAYSCHLGSFLWRLRLLFLARSLRGCPIELLGLHVRARFAEAVSAQDMLADGTVIFRVELQMRSTVYNPTFRVLYCQIRGAKNNWTP